MKRFLLGVDGGNTKADFLLCDADGRFVDLMRTSTISHEAENHGFDGATRLLRQHVQTLLTRNGLTIGDVDAIALGLAGADFPFQAEALEKGARTLGIPHCRVANDAMLGIKALSPDGTGVCAVNGTGTVVVGVDAHGTVLQIGGVGDLCGDRAGGGYIARCAINCAYDALYRCGAPTALTDGICALLDIPNKRAFAEMVCETDAVHRNMTGIIRLVDDAALAGDAPAQGLLDTLGVDLGRGIAGCIAELDFPGTVHVVLAGSLWYKLRYPGLQAQVRATVAAHCQKPVQYFLHQAPPAIGGAFWAAELSRSGGLSAAQKQALLDYLTADQYERIIASR